MIQRAVNKEADPTISVVRNNTAGTVNIGSPNVAFAANQTHLFHGKYWKAVYASDETNIDTLLGDDTLDLMPLPDYVGLLSAT